MSLGRHPANVFQFIKDRIEKNLPPKSMPQRCLIKNFVPAKMGFQFQRSDSHRSDTQNQVK